MRIHLSDLWRWDGTIDRGPYAVIGLAAFAFKHNLDRLVASLVFHRPWGLFNYWVSPAEAIDIAHLSRSDARFFATLLLLALPFIGVGVVLTLRRLRDAGLPPALVVLFFVPVVNLVFFLLLAVVPSRAAVRVASAGRGRAQAFLDALMPDHPAGSAAVAALVAVPFGVAATVLATSVIERYGWGLFVALPFCIGLGAVLLYSYHRPHGYGACVGVASGSILLVGVALLAVAVEGAVCLAMAAPIGFLLAFMGGSLGYLIQRPRPSREVGHALLLVPLLFVPSFLTIERAGGPEAPLFAVRTALIVNAPPENVWRQVVAFSELPAPKELIFRLGIAYPIHATIRGHGVGAVRRCEFSTGAFVEPIQVWDEPHLLRFSVTSNPPPMQEWSPYGAIHPPHLTGYLVSDGGQFLLTPLASGRTRLEGTTWYRHHMWPAGYWRLWSDFVIHRIHRRVLESIKMRAE